MDLDYIRQQVKSIEDAKNNPAEAHALEDELMLEFIQHVIDYGDKDLSAKADEVTKARSSDFDRICGSFNTPPTDLQIKQNQDRIREDLAEYAHDAWSGWMNYLFEWSETNEDGSETIPKDSVDRWKYQLDTPYDELPEKMKESDRREADEMIKLVRANS